MLGLPSSVRLHECSKEVSFLRDVTTVAGAAAGAAGAVGAVGAVAAPSARTSFFSSPVIYLVMAFSGREMRGDDNCPGEIKRGSKLATNRSICLQREGEKWTKFFDHFKRRTSIQTMTAGGGGVKRKQHFPN